GRGRARGQRAGTEGARTDRRDLAIRASVPVPVVRSLLEPHEAHPVETEHVGLRGLGTDADDLHAESMLARLEDALAEADRPRRDDAAVEEVDRLIERLAIEEELHDAVVCGLRARDVDRVASGALDGKREHELILRPRIRPEELRVAAPLSGAEAAHVLRRDVPAAMRDHLEALSLENACRLMRPA